ncbi:diguanylate cyclase [Photobacterium sagamiensis]|uniref:diguanylate cyclase domain-containing protein n=1 Tax=Photobacterium sagamiensis TaxID=2910241 RepID=UPI003D1055A1
MTVCLKDEFNQLVDLLARQANMERWCQLVLPIQMHDRNVGYIYAETLEAKHFEANFEYVEKLLVLLSSDISARVLREEVIHHNLTRRSVEAELLAKDHSINAYLSLLRNFHEVTLALAKAPGLDELYRTAVYLGRKQLGIDRMAIFLTDFIKNEMKGTYGTDPLGNLVQRSDFTSPIPDHPLVNEALSHKDHVVVKENAPLYYGTNQVGIGWNAMIAINSAQAAFIAEEMLLAISELALEHRASPPGRVTISIGSQTLTPDGDNHPKKLISAADEALYLAKESGRGLLIQWDSTNMSKI